LNRSFAERSVSHTEGETMMRSIMTMAVLALFLCSCGAGENPASAVAVAKSVAQSAASAVAPAASFEATISGALDRTLRGEYVPAGSMYGRYHINMASKEPKGGDPYVVIAFGRDDTSHPTPGTYTLAGLHEGGFSGSVEIYSDPQRDFDITSGELVITSARGDVITGRFDLMATESPEEYGDPAEEIRVKGTFRSQPAK
jgi:hypothetical protein